MLGRFREPNGPQTKENCLRVLVKTMKRPIDSHVTTFIFFHVQKGELRTLLERALEHKRHFFEV